MVGGKRIFKKVLCLLLVFIMSIGAISFPEQSAKAADTREYTVLSTATTGERDAFAYYPSAGWSRGKQMDEYFTSKPVQAQVSEGATASDIYYTVTFSGTGIALYGYKDPGHGATVKVSVDGEEKANFDSYAAQRSSSDVVLWNIAGLDNGEHTLKAEATGGKNASASNSHIEVTKAVVTVPIELVPATDFFFQEDAGTIREGESRDLAYRLEPENAYAPEDLQFASDDASVASVDSSGRITAKNVGTALITASSESVGFSKSMEIKVLERKEDIDATYVDSGDQYQQKAYAGLLAGSKKLGEQVWAWKNDKAVAEIAVMSKQKALENVSVSITDLEGFGAVIPASSVKLSFVKEVKAYTGHAGWYAYNKAGTMPSGPREYFPEVIYSDDPVSMDSGRLQLVWVEASVPKDALAGIYKGTITVSAENTDETISLDYALEVLDAEQPDPQDYDFDVEYWSHPYNVAYYYDVEPFSDEHLELLRQHMELYKSLGGHAVTASIVEEAWGGQTYGGGNDVHYPSMIKWIKNADGTWEFDYTDFDKWVVLNLEIGIADKIICYSMMPWDGIVKYEDRATNTVESMTANPGNAAQYGQVWRPFLEDFVAHLDDKGWFDITYIGFDERTNMGTAFDLIDSVTNKDGKALKKSAAFNDFSHNLAIFNRLDYASVGLQQIRENLTPFKQQIVTRREKNQSLTMYTATEHVPNSFTKSNPVESYWTILYAGSLNTTGFLRWAYDAWVEDPLEESTHSSFPAGDCFLVYPSEQEDEVKESKFSLRLAKLDEGVRDINKLYIMREESQEMADGVTEILSHVQGDGIGDYEYSTMPQTDSWGREAKWLTASGKDSMLSDMRAVKRGIYDLTRDFIAQEYPDRVQQIELTKPDRTEFETDEAIQLQIAVQPASAEDSVRWSSSDDAVASVDENGRITMKKEGKATITVCSAENANIGQSLEISIKIPEEWKLLLQQIDAASDLDQENYSQEGWNALQDAVSEARNALEAGNAEAVEEARKKLEAAIAYTKTEETEQTKEQLNNLYEACAEEYDEADYAPESWQVFQQALQEARKVLDKGPSAALEEIRSANERLEGAIAGLRAPGGTANPGGDKEAAERKKKEAAKQVVAAAKKKADAVAKAGRGDYTATSWNAFLSAYNAVKSLTEAQKNRMTADKLKTLADNLTKAQAALQKEVKKEKISSLKFASKTYQIANGKSVNLKKELAILPASAANQKLVWKISSAKFAKLNSGTGVVKALKKGVKKTVTVTVTTEDGKVSAKATVKVMKGRVSRIAAKGAKKVRAKAGKSVTLMTSVKTTGGKPVNKALKWTSSNTAVATVKGVGKQAASAKVKIAKGAKKGKKAAITAVSTDGTNKKLKFTVTVK